MDASTVRIYLGLSVWHQPDDQAGKGRVGRKYFLDDVISVHGKHVRLHRLQGRDEQHDPIDGSRVWPIWYTRDWFRARLDSYERIIKGDGRSGGFGAADQDTPSASLC